MKIQILNITLDSTHSVGDGMASLADAGGGGDLSAGQAGGSPITKGGNYEYE